MTITPQQAARFFAERLALQTDASDVQAALATAGALTTAAAPTSAAAPTTADPGFVLIDARSAAAWDQGHLPGAVHLPHAEIPTRAAALLDPAVPVVAYCWGPGCNGATRAALALSLAGYQAREMIGGIEYWIREGFPITAGDGEIRRPADDLTAVCGC